MVIFYTSKEKKNIAKSVYIWSENYSFSTSCCGDTWVTSTLLSILCCTFYQQQRVSSHSNTLDGSMTQNIITLASPAHNPPLKQQGNEFR